MQVDAETVRISFDFQELDAVLRVIDDPERIHQENLRLFFIVDKYFNKVTTNFCKSPVL
jgi:hypothetical protein